MNKLSPDIAEMTRKNEQIILQFLSKAKQSNVASALNVSEPTITRMKDGEITKISSFLAACGLKVVSADSMEIDQNELAALETLSKKWLEARANRHWGES